MRLINLIQLAVKLNSNTKKVRLTVSGFQKICQTNLFVYINLLFKLVVLNFLSFIKAVAGRLATSFASIILISTKSKVDHISSKRSGGRRGVSREIILGDLSLRIRLVFKILHSKSLNQRPPRSTPRRPQRSVHYSA